MDAHGVDWTDTKVTEVLVDACSKIPTLILTERGDVDTATRAVKAGAIEIVEKPFIGRGLLRSIKLTLDETPEELH